MIGQEWINGPNMVFKRTLLSSLGGFNPALGMSGKRISYGEETRLLLELSKKNIPVYYAPDMKVYHLVPDYKMSLRWLLASFYFVGRCSSDTFGRKRSLRSHLVGLVKNVLFAVRKMVVMKKMPLKRRLYYSLSNFLLEYGAMVEYIVEKVRKTAGVGV
jgi:GT2 family glycosyltransferase